MVDNRQYKNIAYTTQLLRNCVIINNKLCMSYDSLTNELQDDLRARKVKDYPYSETVELNWIIDNIRI